MVALSQVSLREYRDEFLFSYFFYLFFLLFFHVYFMVSFFFFGCLLTLFIIRLLLHVGRLANDLITNTILLIILLWWPLYCCC